MSLLPGAFYVFFPYVLCVLHRVIAKYIIKLGGKDLKRNCPPNGLFRCLYISPWLLLSNH